MRIIIPIPANMSMWVYYLPISLNGSSSSYYCDYYYQNTGDRIAHVGGYWADASPAGLAYWILTHSAASSYRSLGSRCFAKS